MKKDSKIYVAGHTGLVGSALIRKLEAEGYTNRVAQTHSELDLERQTEVEAFFGEERPEYVFLAAAKVGGILANSSYPAEFIYSNLAVQTNVIHTAWKTGVKRLVFLGSSCIYPRDCPQPMKEDYVLTGPLEATNEPYAIAKIAGLKMCQSYNRQYGTNFIAVMPTNLYGPNDNFDLETSHVLAALIRKFHLAKLAASGDWEAIKKDESRYGPLPDDFRVLSSISKSYGHDRLLPAASRQLPAAVTLWGTGKPRREFLHVDDLADACLFIMNLPDDQFDSLLFLQSNSTVRNAMRHAPCAMPLINIGWGKDISIKELAELIQEIVGFEGEITFDTTKPDGTPQKLLDVSKMENFGWLPKVSLRDGIKQTYDWCLENSIF